MSASELESMLKALREQARGLEAPERVEASLRGAFRAQARGRRARWPLALAAAIVLLIASAAWMARSKPQVQVAVQPAPKPAPVQAVVEPAPVVVTRTPPKPVRRRAGRVLPQPPPEIATEFLPLEETTNLAPIESGQVVRMQLPRSTMIRFGLPVNQDRMLEPVNADVVFAQDGIARAIRFVK